MSGKLLGLGQSRPPEEQDFELNIASIIDCFTVLITYLLMAASFISLGMLDVSVPSIGASRNAAPEPKLTLGVKLKQSGQIQIKASGAKSFSASIPSKGGKWDFDALEAQAKTLKERWSQLDTVMVAADPLVEYRPLVRAVDEVHKHVANVFIGEK